MNSDNDLLCKVIYFHVIKNYVKEGVKRKTKKKKSKFGNQFYSYTLNIKFWKSHFNQN